MFHGPENKKVTLGTSLLGSLLATPNTQCMVYLHHTLCLGTTPTFDVTFTGFHTTISFTRIRIMGSGGVEVRDMFAEKMHQQKSGPEFV